MDLLERKDEIMLMAPTGAAADTIGGNTYHTSLGISINRLRKGVWPPESEDFGQRRLLYSSTK
jgi:hypothetical protein